MKNFLYSKNYYRTALICLVGGLIVFFIGTSLLQAGESVSLGGSSTLETKTEVYEANAIQTIHVTDSNATVEVNGEASDREIQVDTTESTSAYYVQSVNGSTLTIDKHQDAALFNMFGSSGTGVVVSVPDNWKGTLILETSNGTITVMDATIESLKADTSNSSIHIKDLTVQGKVDCVSSNGSINVEELECASFEAKTSNSSIHCYDLVSKGSISATTSNGRIEAKDISFTDSMKLDTSNAGITVSLNMPASSIEVTCDTSNGECHVPQGSGPNKVTIDTSNASVELEAD